MGKDFGLARVHLIETALGEGRGYHLDELIDERLVTRMSDTRLIALGRAEKQLIVYRGLPYAKTGLRARCQKAQRHPAPVRLLGARWHDRPQTIPPLGYFTEA